jgi:hypothetical protein
VLFGRRSCGRIRAGQRGRASQRLHECVLIDWIDEDPGLWRDELGRPADPRCDDGSPTRHRFEHGLPEGLDQAGLADDMRCGDLRGDPVVGKRTREVDPRPPFELSAERPVADERQRPFAELFESAREAEHVLPFDQ